MNKPLLIGALVLFVIAFIATSNAYLDYKIKDSKKIVTVRLIELPNCETGGYRNKFVRFEYNGSEIIKRTKCKYVDTFHVGQNIEMFHKDGTDNFIFPNEEVLTNLVSGLLLGLLALVIAIIAIRKK